MEYLRRAFDSVGSSSVAGPSSESQPLRRERYFIHTSAPTFLPFHLRVYTSIDWFRYLFDMPYMVYPYVACYLIHIYCAVLCCAGRRVARDRCGRSDDWVACAHTSSAVLAEEASVRSTPAPEAGARAQLTVTGLARMLRTRLACGHD